MNKQFRFSRGDINPGTFLKTNLSSELLVVQEMDDFKPWEVPFFAKRLLMSPIMAFKPRLDVFKWLLGPNRCMALGPNGEKFFPKLNQIYYIVNFINPENE